MIIDAGATPAYADINPLTWCLDPVSVEKCITSNTKAIIPVHVYGNVCDMDALKLLAERHRLFIIEDVAEAAFSKYKGQFAGTFGKAGCFSFQATKTITMGEGGFVLTDYQELYEAMCIIRDHGMRKGRRYWHDVVGYNFRLTNLQAAVGCGQLENLNLIISERKRVFQLYRQNLDGEKGITLQHFSSDVEPVVWTIAVKIDPAFFNGDRDFLMEFLLEKGIETRPGFYPPSVMPLYGSPSLTVSEDVAAHVIGLPSFPSLTEAEINFICDQLKLSRQ
jgi:perosamine synthetase